MIGTTRRDSASPKRVVVGAMGAPTSVGLPLLLYAAAVAAAAASETTAVLLTAEATAELFPLADAWPLLGNRTAGSWASGGPSARCVLAARPRARRFRGRLPADTPAALTRAARRRPRAAATC